jgi:hypothetical protein
MSPTGSDNPEVETRAGVPPRESVRRDVVDGVPDSTNTTVPMLPTGLTVPSSAAAGAVWLRYNPQRVRKGGRDSATQL